MTVAFLIVTTVDEFPRFRRPEQVASYLGRTSRKE